MMDTINQPDGVALSAPAVGPDQGLGWRKLLILAAGAFAVGTSEFLMMGTLPGVAADLGVSAARRQQHSPEWAPLYWDSSTPRGRYTALTASLSRLKPRS